MPPKPINVLNYVNVQTRLPLVMHTHFQMIAVKRHLQLMKVYMYALRFAYHSPVEFGAFLDTIQKGKVSNDKQTQSLRNGSIAE